MLLNKRLWIYLLSNAFSIFIRLAHSTNRWEHFNYELPKKYWLNNKPFIWIHWHGQSLMLPRSWDHSSQKLFALVSKHGDGELIANTLSRLQVKLIRGAGNLDKLGIKEKGGKAALRSMIKILEDGSSVSFTADQPPGPGRLAGNGAIILAKLSGCPIVPVAATTSNRYEFTSWDKFTMHLPFGKGAVIWGDPIFVSKNATKEEVENKRNLLEDSLNELTIKANKVVGKK
tara:strand:+ start:171 stop:860 length:690 start_codon:yes stop_codon:yes gene_type:complete